MPVQESNTLRSEQLREFISHRPGWLIRRGIPVLFILITGLVAGSYFIQYPDLMQARARIRSLNPPKQVVSQESGRLFKLLKADLQDVQQGDIIAYIESTASHDEVVQLSAILDTLQNLCESNRLEEIPVVWKSANQPFAKLGELQQPHQTFMQSYFTFNEYLSKGFYMSKKQMLAGDLNTIRQLFQTLQQQKQLQEQDLAITVQNYNVHDTLHTEALINDIDYRNQKSQLINKRMSIPQANASLLNNLAQQHALQKEMLELDNQVVQQKALFVQSLNTYRNAVKQWERKYILTAPIAGKLEFTSFIEQNQQLQAGQVIGYITNPAASYFVEMLVPEAKSGKVKEGQEVLLSFSSYPSQEYGTVKGRIEYIKNIPSDSGYLAKVQLPDGLITHYKKRILFREGMFASAEIITEERSLFDRFFGQFKSMVK